jgi:maltose O-acetyltransferase
MIRPWRRTTLEGEAYRVHYSTNRRAWHVSVNVVAASHLVSPQRRVAIYRANEIDVRTSDIFPSCYFYGNDIVIGPDCWINHRCYFDTRGRIEIGRDTGLAPEVMLCTSTHDVGPPERRYGTYVQAPIVIQRGVWVGTRATILPGVTIGDGCVIAAGAVVREDCAPNGLYGGVPARRIRDLEA